MYYKTRCNFQNCIQKQLLLIIIDLHCTGQMADSVYGVVWVSGLVWQCGYGMGRYILWYILWTTNTGAFYWWHFECTEIQWRDPEAHCCLPSIHEHHLMLQHDNARPHVAMICTLALHYICNSWKLKTSQFLHGQHINQTGHPLSIFRMLWIGVYDSSSSSFQYSKNCTF